jgi:hypothetical protein
MSTGLTILFLAFASAPVALAQQPTIAGVSGSMTQGSLLTISGANLNAETKRGWDGFFVSHPDAWSFEGGIPQNDGYSLVGGNGTQYDTVVKLLGNQSAKYHAQGASTNCPVDNLTDYDYFSLASASSDMWIRLYARWRANGWPLGYIKMFNTLTFPAYYIQPSGGSTRPNNFLVVYDATNHYGQIPSGQLQNDRWYLIEAHVKTSSPTVFTLWVDGTQVFNGTDMKPGVAIPGWLFGLVNLCNTTSTFSVDHWIDGMAVGNTRIYGSATVEVGNNSNYSSATKKVQALEKIADDQVVFRLDTSGLGSGPYYVWVRNNAQQLSPAFLLNVSGGQISGPAAPSNLRIVP